MSKPTRTAVMMYFALSLPALAHADATDLTRARTMKTTGAVLTAVGAASIAAAIATWGVYFADGFAQAFCTPNCTTRERVDLKIAAATLTAAGIGHLGAGLPTLVLGTRREKERRAKLVFTPTGVAGVF